MGKNKKDIRSHSQERDWLRSLGGGDIVEGAKNLIGQLMEEDKEDYYYPTKSWGGLFRKRRKG